MKRAALLAIAIVALVATLGHAITINATFKDSGEALAGFGTAASAPSSAVGGGLLQTIFATAVNYWQNAYSDSHTLSIDYGWFGLAAGTTGTHILQSEGGTPHRETSASIAFDSDLSTTWFIDPTPTDSSEFTTFTNYTADLGGGTMNVGREYTGGTGNATSHDLLSTVLHEIGHALGLSGANDAYVAETGDLDIDVASPLAFAGAAIPVNSGNAHLNMDHPLMRSSRPSGVRRLASEADILANAQVSQFTGVNLNPAIPEPSTVALLSIGMLLLPIARWRRRRAPSAE